MILNRLTVLAHGPLDVEGDLEIQDADGVVLARGDHFRLCRCGRSADAPLCDGTHRSVAFEDEGRVRVGPHPTAHEPPPPGRVVLRMVAGGPWIVSGSFDLIGTRGCLAFRDGRAALCRCGRSNQGPLCDGAHKGAGA